MHPKLDRHIIGVIVALPFFLYLNSCLCGFVFDDLSAVKQNRDVLGETPFSALLWNDYWGTSMTDVRIKPRLIYCIVDKFNTGTAKLIDFCIFTH